MSISELWKEHSQARFPKGYGGTDVNGICVSSLDTYASGCISSYVNGQKDRIELEKYQRLVECRKQLEEVMPNVKGEAFQYFGRLHEMCSLVIVEASIA